jgi:hypothetical protein
MVKGVDVTGHEISIAPTSARRSIAIKQMLDK